MKIRGDIEHVNLSTGEKFQRVTGDGESRLEKVPAEPSSPTDIERDARTAIANGDISDEYVALRVEVAQLRQERDALERTSVDAVLARERAESALGEAREKAVKIIRDELEHWDYRDLADNNKSDLELFVDNVVDQIRAALKSK